MKKYKHNNNKPYLYTVGLIIVLVILLGLFFRNNQYGTLQISSLDENLTIFIDNNQETTEQDINPQFRLTRGKHPVVISKDNFWPWMKEVDIEKQTTTIIKPFFIPQNTSGLLIGEQDPEYERLMALFEKDLTLDSALAKILESNPLLKESITAIDFYKDRQDVVVISVDDGIYAIETDNQSIQNFQPLYKGIDPVFVKKDSSSLYVLDNNNLLIINY